MPRHSFGNCNTAARKRKVSIPAYNTGINRKIQNAANNRRLSQLVESQSSSVSTSDCSTQSSSPSSSPSSTQTSTQSSSSDSAALQKIDFLKT